MAVGTSVSVVRWQQGQQTVAEVAVVSQTSNMNFTYKAFDQLIKYETLLEMNYEWVKSIHFVSPWPEYFYLPFMSIFCFCYFSQVKFRLQDTAYMKSFWVPTVLVK